VGDRFAMMENTYYSVISPEGCAAILWHDGAMAERAAEALKLTARDMLEQGIIDEIIAEPLGGAHRDPAAAADAIKAYIIRAVDELASIAIDTLLDQRYKRYRSIGPYAQV
jgi:acetyl-CoA carboxylase carboxyl transferase subunit alpha